MKNTVLEESEFKIKLKLNSIVLTVGPDGSGKTDFIMEHLMLQLKMAQVGQKKISIAYVSLDRILSELLDSSSFDRDDIQTKQVTEQAYNILFSKVRNFSSYPVNTDFVIVDSNGLDSAIRTEILKIGEDNHYDVSAFIFNYKDKSEHYRIDVQSGEKLRPIPYQMKLMKQLMSGGISKKEYASMNLIQFRDFNKYEISVDDYSLYDQYILPDDKEYVIIGDIHGCFKEFVLLLEKNGFVVAENLKVTHPEGKAVLLVGDIIDKGYNVPDVIRLVHANLDTFYLVMGNHESLVYKKLSGSLKKGALPPADVVGEFFNTIEMLQEPQKPVEPQAPKEGADEKALERYQELMMEYDRQMALFSAITPEEFDTRKELREKLFQIANAMKSFYVHKNFIVTHSPCEKKYLGKITTAALKATRDFRYPKIRDYKTYAEFMYDFDERIRFLLEESSDFHPIHVFGHVMSKEMSRYKNKINIDTACVAGGKLTSIQIDSRREIYIQDVESTLEQGEHKMLHSFFSQNSWEQVLS